MSKKLILTVLICGIVVAGEVTGLIEFKPNTTAKSSEVNQNFNTIKDAVNDNNQRIGNLEGFRDNLKGNCPNGSAMTGVNNDGSITCEDMNKGKKILSVTYHGSCFAISIDPTKSVPSVYYKGAYLVDKDGTSNFNWIYCPVTLPEGSKLLKIIASVYDNTSAGYILVDLWNIAGQVGRSPQSQDTGNQRLEINFTTNPVVVQRNPDEALVIAVYFSSDTQLLNLMLRAVTVIYEYDPTYSGSPP